MTPEQTLDWLAEQHKSQCNEDRPVQEWIRSMKSMLPAPVQEPVEFGMHGKKMMFKVGVQQFTLDYEPDTQEEVDFMREMLIHAFSTFTPDVKTTPPAAQRQRVVFPTMLCKMWSGGEVQKWLDENVNKENT